MAIYAIEALVLSVTPSGAEGTMISAGKSTFTVPLSSPLSEGDKIMVVSKNRPTVGGTVIGVIKGGDVLFTAQGVCSSAVRFASLLNMSRNYGFMKLTKEDRIWLMEQRSHVIECEDCQAVHCGHKELGG